MTRVRIDPAQAHEDWPYTLPAVAQILEHGLELDPGITVLIGANGSGKSTIVEALAATWARRVTAFRPDWMQQAVAAPSGEDSDLDRALRLDYTAGGPTGGLFLRAERMHAQLAGFTGTRGRWQDRLGRDSLLERSHGEGFLEVLAAMSAEAGLYIMDEPESALSFDSCLMLLTLMSDMRAAGSQIVLATHSPILCALPGTRLLSLDDRGITEVSYDESDLVAAWRAFLADPAAFVRHLAR